MNIAIIETLHVIIATTIVGLTIANYFYCTINFNTPLLSPFILRISLLFDLLIIVPAIIFTVITGVKLVNLYHFSFDTDWIKAVFLIISIILGIQICLAIIKLLYYLNDMITKSVYFKYPFHFFYWIIILGYVIIIHDAVMRRALLFS